MLETAIILLGILVASMTLQLRIKIPMPLTTMSIVMGLVVFGIRPIDISNELFDAVTYLVLPLLILADVVHLKPSMVKQHWKSIFMTAGVGVIVSVVMGVLLKEYILPEYNISIPLMIMLMTAVIATDPVTTGAIFSNYELPEDLKFLVESESLFNDAKVIIIFSLALFVHQNPDVTYIELTQIGFEKVFIAIGVGIVVGLVSILLLELINDAMTTATTLVLAVMLSLHISENMFHAAGVLSIVVTGLTITTSIFMKAQRSEHNIEEFENMEIGHRITHTILDKFKNLAIVANNKEKIVDYIGFMALFANTVLFVSMASLVNFDLLFTYWKEILSVFAATVIIRAAVMFGFMCMSNNLVTLRNISFDWWAVLTAAGIKGGLSILLLHHIPEFEHTDLFEAIIVGVILLSTFFYAGALTLIIKFRKDKINAFAV